MNSYASVMQATWDALYLAPDDAVAALCAAGALPEGADSLDFELARRRRTVIRTLRSVYPVSFFSFYGMRGREGLVDLLASQQWKQRPTHRNSAFPDTEHAARAFDAYVQTTPLADPTWWAGFHAFETSLLFADRGVPLRSDGDVTLRSGAWVADCAYDAVSFAHLVAEAIRDTPWEDVLWVVRPRPRPVATLSMPDQGRVRRVVLRGAQYEAFRPFWDPTLPAPDPAEPVIERARSAGIVVAADRARVGAR